MSFIRDNFLGGAEEAAAEKQAKASDEGIVTQREFGGQAVAGLDDFSNVGRDAISGGGGEDPASLLANIRNDDNLNFERGQGFEQINKAAAAGGKGLLSGERGIDLVTLDRGLRTRNSNNRINQLLQVVNQGRAAATSQGGFLMSTGTNISNLQVGKGDALAAGIIGKKNAISSTISEIAKAATGSKYLDTFKSRVS